MYACVFSVFVSCCVDSGLGVLPTVGKIHSFTLIPNGNKPEGLTRQRKRRRKKVYVMFFPTLKQLNIQPVRSRESPGRAEENWGKTCQ
jgi:hypothetical protein